MKNFRARLNRAYSQTRNLFSEFLNSALVFPLTATGRSVVRSHFRQRNLLGHVNRIPMTKALDLLKRRKALIVETGSSAHGTDSTRLWATYVELFGGRLISVDISAGPSEELGFLGSFVQLHVDDSVEFLRNLKLPQGFDKIDLLFLDSCDVDLSNPGASAEHGRSELLAALGLLGTGSLVLIDDTPRETKLWGNNAELAEQHLLRTGVIPGKGSAILRDKDLMSHFEVLYHSYAILLRYR